MPYKSISESPAEVIRILIVDLASGQGQIKLFDKRNDWVGGSGLAAALFNEHALFDKPWNHPDQPLIFAIGPLTGHFPLMSKTVCAFKSPYHDQYAESHAGGRSALALRLSGLDALVLKGKAKRLSALTIGSRLLKQTDVHFLAGMGAFQTGKLLRSIDGGGGIRSIMRIGPAGEKGLATACINVDSYRHFGRLGGGGVMGDKNLKGITILGDGHLNLPQGKDYAKLFSHIHQQVTATEMMRKYHSLGTAANITGLNELRALPVRNLQATSDPNAAEIGGESFAREALLRNGACAGCPVGCIHIGFVRDMFTQHNRYKYVQVAYDFEPIFAVGSMLGITDHFEVLRVLDEVEKQGLDVMSAGVALAWATEALEKGLISQAETIAPLEFGQERTYRHALKFLGGAENDFYQLLANGTLKAAAEYGGQDFSCVLGQEMAGYATGEMSYISQALGLRHSHLDTGGYSLDQKGEAPPLDQALDFLIKDEQVRVMLTSMVSCLFARSVYTEEILSQALSVLGMNELAGNLTEATNKLTGLRWQVRLACGYKPQGVKIPKRFFEIENWKGVPSRNYYNQLAQKYSEYINSKAA